jgi:hypothetical protein
MRRRHLTRRSTGGGDDVDPPAFTIELYQAFDQGEEGEVFSLTNSLAGIKPVADLPNKDAASRDPLARETLDAPALPVRIATVAAGTLTFFVCHDCLTLQRLADKPAGEIAGRLWKRGHTTGTRPPAASYAG